MNRVLKASLVSAAALFIGSFGVTRATAEIKTRTIEYKDGEVTLEGYLAYDDAIQGPRPGILVVHTWTGIGDFIQDRTRQLAAMGYVAFAPDIYGKGIRPKPPGEAGAEMKKYTANRSLMRSRTQAGLAVLRNTPNADKNKLIAIGFCFGGTSVLELARDGASILGVVGFHAGPIDSPTPEDAKKIKGRVLLLHGADDPVVPPVQVAAFVKEMREAKVDWQLVSYGNAVHAFTDPASGNDNSKGAAYNKDADKRSWSAMQTFFRDVLQN